MDHLLADIRYALRLLWKSPGFTAVAIITLGLGIGANTAIFSALDSILLRPMPYPDSDKLVYVWEDASFVSFPRNTPAPANYIDWQNRNRSFSGIAALRYRTASFTSDGSPEQALGSGVTTNFFEVFGVKPQLGRPFVEAEQDPGSRVIIIGHGLWQRRYAGDPDIINRVIKVNGENFTIVGVMPATFRFPISTSEFWVPIRLTKEEWARRGNHFLTVIARLKPSVTVEQSQADMTDIAAQLQREYPDSNAKLGAVVVPMRENMTGNTRVALIILLGAAGAVLLIAAANLANLLLARSSARIREMAVRTALGAEQSRIFMQLITESIVLSILGGALGIALAMAGLRFMESFVPGQMQAWVKLTIDSRILLFTLGVSVLTGLLFGLAPAIQSARLSIQDALKQGGRGDLSGHGQRFRQALVVLEVALAVVLVTGAGLLVQTLVSLRGLQLGFDPQNVLLVRTSLPPTKYTDTKSRMAFYSAVIDKVKVMPGVTGAVFFSNPPFSTFGNTNGFTIEGQPPQRDSDALYRAGTHNGIAVLKPKLKEGRLYDESDQDPNRQPVVVINETFARRYWPNASPLGHRIRYGASSPWMTIIGVIHDMQERGYELEMKPATYVPFGQVTGGDASSLIVRTTNDPMSLSSAIRQAIHSVDPEQPVFGFRAYQNLIDSELQGRNQQLTLLSSFAGLGLLLAALGIYGVLSIMVAMRTRELGLRIALGATAREVLSLILKRGAALTGIGLAVGLIAAFVLRRSLQGFLYGVPPTDYRSLAVAAVVLAVASVLACYLPARRAATVDPMVALRDE